jgi:hypothetical protein
MSEVKRCVLLCMLEAAEGVFCLPEKLEVLKVMRCVLLLYILPGEIAAELGWFLPQFVAVFSPPLDPCLFAALTEVRGCARRYKPSEK